MTDDREKKKDSPEEPAPAPGSSGAASQPAAAGATEATRGGLLQKLTFVDILKLVTLIVAVISPTAAAYFTFSSQVEKLNAAVAERDREADEELKLLRTGVLHLQAFQAEAVPFYASQVDLPDKLELSIELARCEVANGRVDAIAVTCGAANDLLVGSPVPSGYGEVTSPGVSPPAIAVSPAEEVPPP